MPLKIIYILSQTLKNILIYLKGVYIIIKKGERELYDIKNMGKYMIKYIIRIYSHN